jgi:pimeloyl-ACP methyl ester carboxylesterase
VYKPAVIMLHGLIDSSDSYILNGPGKAPGFIAADEDYDVWVPNTRGNRYSIMHETLDPYSDE